MPLRPSSRRQGPGSSEPSSLTARTVPAKSLPTSLPLTYIDHNALNRACMPVAALRRSCHWFSFAGVTPYALNSIPRAAPLRLQPGTEHSSFVVFSTYLLKQHPSKPSKHIGPGTVRGGALPMTWQLLSLQEKASFSSVLYCWTVHRTREESLVSRHLSGPTAHSSRHSSAPRTGCFHSPRRNGG